MSLENDVETPSTSVDRSIGRVKWFNNKAGYGFITITDGDRSGSDIFVHHSSIQVENQQYKYLVQGEYVEFSLSNTPSGNHEFQAAHVSGIKSGKLMCETRYEFKLSRNNYKSDSTEPRESLEKNTEYQPRQKSVSRVRNEKEEEKKDWTMVKNKDEVKPRGRPRKVVNPN
jgi:CspA family cold shock protein